MSRTKRFSMGLAGCVLASVSCGCVLGPVALDVSRVRYNEVIQKTKSEELLLNLVRLQYREAPMFLEVGSVSAQFNFKGTADIVGTINEGPTEFNPDVMELGAGIGYEEKPTITFTPLQGEDFQNRILSPLDLNALVLLSHSGWNIDRIFRITLQDMNGLDNASNASGPTPDLAPRYEEFGEVTRLFRELQKKGLLESGYETREGDLSLPVPADKIAFADAVSAIGQGYGLRLSEDGKKLILTRRSQALVWRIPPAARGGPEVTRIVELLGLDPEQDEYEFRVGRASRSVALAEGGKLKQIYMTTRSLMGVYFYLSQAVEVPDRHRARGIVTTTVDADGQVFDWARVTGSLLRVRSDSRRPKHASVAVQYRGVWFYVDDADLTSKSTFGLLSQLFALQAGEAKSVAPVLTLPVGG